MSKKEKKAKTPTERKKTLRAWQYTTFWGEFVSVFTPFIVIGIVNYDEYFIQYNGTKTSIAFILAMAVMGIAIWLISSKKFKNTYSALLVGWATIDLIFFLLGQIINDIAYIMLFGWFGLLGAQGLEIAHTRLKEKADKIDAAIEKAEEEITKEEYKEELKDKNEGVPID